MWPGFFWQKWRRTLPVLFFLTQYYARMVLLALRYRVRNLSRAEIASQAYEHWHRLCQALTCAQAVKTALSAARKRLEREPLSGKLHTIRQNLESEHFHRTLAKARRTLAQLIFIEECPTRPLQRVVAPETSKALRLPPVTLRSIQRSLKTLKTADQHTMALITAGLVSLLLVTLFAASGWLSQTLHTMQNLGIASVSRLINSEVSIKAHRIEGNASHALVRLSQLDEGEYVSQAEYDTWAYSACSAASITEVLNAYGYRYRISDVLQVESRLGEITPQLGLVENVGIANTAAQFGFQTTWGNHWTLAQIINMANMGRPVIVGWPPQLYDGGHIVVVTGGDADSVYLADSSLWNRRVLSHAQFLHWWAGFAAVMTPV